MLPMTSVTLRNEKLSRYFNILKLVLLLMPFLCIGYLGLGAGGVALDAEGVLAASPAMAVSFLAAMVQPYAAWIVILAERRLADGRTDYALVNLTLVLIAELMLMSTAGAVGLAVVLWKSVRCYQTGIPAAFRDCEKRAFVREAGGCVPLLALAGLCLFASLRLGIGF